MAITSLKGMAGSSDFAGVKKRISFVSIRALLKKKRVLTFEITAILMWSRI